MIGDAIVENKLKQWMSQYIASVLNCDAAAIDETDTFDNVGLDSVEAVIMAGLMEEEFQMAVDPIELYENPSIAEFAAHFVTKNGAAEGETKTA